MSEFLYSRKFNRTCALWVLSPICTFFFYSTLQIAAAESSHLTAISSNPASNLEQSKLPADVNLRENVDGFLIVDGPEGSGVFTGEGKEIISPKYSEIHFVGENLFVVMKYREDSSADFSLVNGEGRIISSLPDWSRIDNRRFREGILDIGDPNAPSTFIDKSGKIVLVCDEYRDVKEFSEGLASASYSDQSGVSWSGFIDHSGKMVIGPFKNAELSPFDGGLSIVSEWIETGEHRCGVINTNGSFVIPLDYDRVRQYTDGKFLALKNQKLSVLDNGGKLVFEFPAGCVEAVAPQAKSDDVPVTCVFERIEQAQNGEILKTSKWGFCDSKGEILIEPKFAYAGQFKGNRAIASDKSIGVFGVISKSGNWVIEPKYTSVEIVDDEHYVLGTAALEQKFETAGYQRRFVFQDYLQSNNLIGMKKDELDKLFGIAGFDSATVSNPGNIVKSTTYSLSPGAHCGNSNLSLEFGFDLAGKIVGWRVIDGISIPRNPNPWITENVVVVNRGRGLQIGNLAPKTH